jgi:tetratricopeptide (TPR) repeat protein
LTLREKLVAEHPDVAEHRKDLAVGLVNLAGAQEFESGFREAAANYTLALALLEKLPVDLRDSPECSFHQALCRQGLGLALTIEGRSRDAEESERQALATLEMLVRDFPTEPTYRHRLAWNLSFVGAHCTPARSPEGEKLLLRAIAIEEKLAADFPTVPDYAQVLAICRRFQGLWLIESGRSREGEQTLAEASQVIKKLVAGFPGAYDYFCELSNLNCALAAELLASGRLQEAEEALRGNLTIMEKSAANSPANPFFRHLTALTHHYLGEVLCEARRSPEAEREYRQGLSIWSELLAAHPDNAGHRTWLACAHNNLAELFTTAPDEQYRDAVRAVPLARKAVELHPQPGGCWNTLGITLYRAGDWNPAVNALEKSRELRRGGDWYDWFFLAMAHWRLGHKEEARQWYDQAIAWMEKNAGELAGHKPKHAQFCRFRTEAAELLGVELR